MGWWFFIRPNWYYSDLHRTAVLSFLLLTSKMIYIFPSPLPAANRSIDILVFPSSLWPDSELLKYHCPTIGSSRCTGATYTLVLMSLFAMQMDSRSPIRECKDLGYSVFKVHCMGVLTYNHKSSIENLITTINFFAAPKIPEPPWLQLKSTNIERNAYKD